MTLGRTGLSGKTQVVVSVVVILVIIVISNIIVTHYNIKHTGTEGSVDYGCGGRGEESGGGRRRREDNGSYVWEREEGGGGRGKGTESRALPG